MIDGQKRREDVEEGFEEDVDLDGSVVPSLEEVDERLQVLRKRILSMEIVHDGRQKLHHRQNMRLNSRTLR